MGRGITNRRRGSRDNWKFLNEKREPPRSQGVSTPEPRKAVAVTRPIIKVQLPISTSMPGAIVFALVYEKGRVNSRNVEVTDQIRKLMGRDLKQYFYVNEDKTWEKAPWQSW